MPEIAAAAGVSPRTFNNYFSSKEEAIAWPAARRVARLAECAGLRPAEEDLREALLAAIEDAYSVAADKTLPAGSLPKLRALVAGEPGLRGEFLKAAQAAEQALARVIAARTGAGEDELAPRVVAAIVVGAERAATIHWMNQKQKPGPLRDSVVAAVQLALSEVDG